jgi:hypothetical protein
VSKKGGVSRERTQSSGGMRNQPETMLVRWLNGWLMTDNAQFDLLATYQN